MSDFAAARRMMVDGQVRTADVTDLRLIGAMLEIPRERFLPAGQAPLAYLDLDVALGEGADARRLLKPMVLAKLIQAADVKETDHVLDVGCGTGYSSVVLARLAASVIGMEQDTALTTQADGHLHGTRNVTFVTGRLAEGFAASAPYDVILINGACEIEPRALLGQLKDGGRLVCVSGRGPAAKAMLWRRSGDAFGERAIFDATAPTLADFVKPPTFAF